MQIGEISVIVVDNYTLDDEGIIRTKYKGKDWIIRDWRYIKEIDRDTEEADA
jgi:hypothetical protein